MPAVSRNPFGARMPQTGRRGFPIILAKRKSGDYTVAEIVDTVTLSSDISGLYEFVERSLEQGARHIAVRFTEESFLYTPHIAVLVKCLESVREAGGSLAVVKPNRDVKDVLFLIDQERLIRMVDHEDMLASSAVEEPPG
jgi:anti-anti-sigma regulatory factor